MQADPLVIKCSELMRLGQMPSAQEIKNGMVSPLQSEQLLVLSNDPLAQDPLTVDISSAQAKAKLNLP